MASNSIDTIDNCYRNSKARSSCCYGNKYSRNVLLSKKHCKKKLVDYSKVRAVNENSLKLTSNMKGDSMMRQLSGQACTFRGYFKNESEIVMMGKNHCKKNLVDHSNLGAVIYYSRKLTPNVEADSMMGQSTKTNVIPEGINWRRQSELLNIHAHRNETIQFSIRRKSTNGSENDSDEEQEENTCQASYHIPYLSVRNGSNHGEPYLTGCISPKAGSVFQVKNVDKTTIKSNQISNVSAWRDNSRKSYDIQSPTYISGKLSIRNAFRNEMDAFCKLGSLFTSNSSLLSDEDDSDMEIPSLAPVSRPSKNMPCILSSKAA